MRCTYVYMSAHSDEITMTRALRRTVRKLGVLAAHLGVTQPVAMDVALTEALSSRQIPLDVAEERQPAPRRKRKTC